MGNRKIFRRMRGMGTKAFVLGAGLCLVGCASVTRLNDCCGMKVEDGLTPIETVENQMKMLEAEVRRTGARKAINVVTVSTDETAFLFLLMREKLHTTAVLVK